MTTVAGPFDTAIPETASPDVEFISATASNASTETKRLGASKIDLEFFRTWAARDRGGCQPVRRATA